MSSIATNGDEDKAAANRALDIAFRGDTSAIDDDMASLFARHSLILIMRLVEQSEAIAFQAGVGSMETAGSIVSYLAKHPDQIPALMDGKLSVLDWPTRWHIHGCLSWHGQDGKIYTPEAAQRASAQEPSRSAASSAGEG